MSQLQLLKSAVSLHDVAALLQFKPKAVAFILYRELPAVKYSSFEIAKRRGGVRQISAPSPPLKRLQRNLSDLLQNCLEEINRVHRLEDRLAHGFKRGHSIIDNATKHRKRRYVLNIDLHNFFGTINFGRVRGFFLNDNNFRLHPAVATVLAQIACHENSLPQGSPCSPVISNLIGHLLDIHLCKLASQTGCTYSRYADDITFSTNKREFPPSIAIQTEGEGHNWTIGDKLQEIVTRSGFVINPAKTRMQYHTSRQDVTGLVVNRKVNIRSEYRRTVRAMAHRLFMTGHFEFIQLVPSASGVLEPTKAEGDVAQLHGMLGHIDRIDRHNLRLRSREPGRSQNGAGIGSKENLYRRFLMFKEFYAAPAPVVVCEGKTDIIYILHAIRSSAPTQPSLATVSPDGTITLNVRIFKYPDTSTGRILRLTGGTGHFTTFISDYVKEMKRFQAPGKEHAVVLLVDNDQGAKAIYKTVQQIAGTKPTGREAFVHIAGNLYLVPTPLEAGQTESVIEHSFTEQTRNVILDGKSFNPNQTLDPERNFGKHVFSKYVEKNADKIDFTGFAEILTRLAAAIEAHKAAIAETATAGASA